VCRRFVVRSFPNFFREFVQILGNSARVPDPMLHFDSHGEADHAAMSNPAEMHTKFRCLENLRHFSSSWHFYSTDENWSGTESGTLPLKVTAFSGTGFAYEVMSPRVLSSRVRRVCAVWINAQVAFGLAAQAIPCPSVALFGRFDGNI